MGPQYHLATNSLLHAWPISNKNALGPIYQLWPKPQVSCPVCSTGHTLFSSPWHSCSETNTLVSRPAFLWADVFCIWNCDYRVLMNRSLALCVFYFSSAFAYVGIFLLFKVAGRFVTFFNSCRNVTFCNSQSHEKPREKKCKKHFWRNPSSNKICLGLAIDITL